MAAEVKAMLSAIIMAKHMQSQNGEICTDCSHVVEKIYNVEDCQKDKVMMKDDWKNQRQMMQR